LYSAGKGPESAADNAEGGQDLEEMIVRQMAKSFYFI